MDNFQDPQLSSLYPLVRRYSQSSGIWTDIMFSDRIWATDYSFDTRLSFSSLLYSCIVIAVFLSLGFCLASVYCIIQYCTGILLFIFGVKSFRGNSIHTTTREY
ncbi:hypothetical protein P691DRAFT_568150 [Macrolepiota fuliginosa MF-IS2]|uniref:Uncharacterized protein n=1 Tax=Macrolepiota fuliginosa MF-IS2 TaxID=1400762 RepID=A0A9P5XFS8_9AGAR|nr:hypothetical protein P691DRAFT_568150 [Macrolepiota fuliginosa MF-IS2]